MRVVTLGESMGLIRGSGLGTFAQLGSAEIDTGGAEGNVAIGLARLGVSVTWLGRVGDDSIGRRVVRDLRGEGVDARAIIDPHAPTGLMLKEAPRSGSTKVTYYRSGSAGSRLCPEDLDDLAIEAADVLHVSGVSLAISDSACNAVTEAVQRARAAGVTVSFDVNHRSRLWSAETASPHYRCLVADADIVFAGEDEAALTLGFDSIPPLPQLMSSLAELGANEIVIKRGANGAAAFADGELSVQDAARVDVVDTVGAGDAFVAGYLADRLAGAPLAQRLRTATLTGAFACLHPGDWQGAATRAELEAFGDDPVSR